VPTIGLLGDHPPDQIPASHRDLVQCPPVTALTTVMADGSPQISVVWCDFEGVCVRVNTMRGFGEARNMRANPPGHPALLRPSPAQPLPGGYADEGFVASAALSTL
jgi:Pyridoxamine 5'-phosphate oxidase